MSVSPGSNGRHRCPLCRARFPDRKAVQNHIGVRNQALAVAHRCLLCEQQFCSEGAMLQHQNAPSHNTMFKCDNCGKHFRAKQDRNNHQRVLGHTAVRSPVNFVPAGWSNGRDSGPTGRWKVDGITERLMDMDLDEDWTLCDKDCGWCGQCAESVVY